MRERGSWEQDVPAAAGGGNEVGEEEPLPITCRLVTPTTAASFFFSLRPSSSISTIQKVHPRKLLLQILFPSPHTYTANASISMEEGERGALIRKGSKVSEQQLCFFFFMIWEIIKWEWAGPYRLYYLLVVVVVVLACWDWDKETGIPEVSSTMEATSGKDWEDRREKESASELPALVGCSCDE